MSAPRLVVCGLEPGPAVALAAGALLAAFADERAVRPVLLGVDLPLWRLLYGASARTPRVLDPRLLDDAAAAKLYDEWASGTDLTAVVAVEPALDRWDGVKGSRPLDVALALDAPLVLVVDARERGATVGAWACGVKLLARASSSPASSSSAATSRAARRASGASSRRPPACRCSAGCRRSSASSSRASTVARRVAAADRAAAGQGRRGRAVPRGGHVPGPRRDRGGGRPARLPARAAAPAAGAAAGGHGAQARRRLGRAARAVRAREHRPLRGAGPRARRRSVWRGRGTAAGAAASTRGPARRGAAGGVRRQRGAQDGHRGGHRRRPAHAGARRRRAAAAPPPRRQSRAHARARRGAAGRGRAPRVVRPAALRGATAARENPYAQGEATLYELFDLEFLTLQQEAFAWRLGGAEEGQVEGFVHERCLATTLVPSLPRCPSSPPASSPPCGSAAPDA